MVPAVTIPKPIHTPQTVPQRIAKIPEPKSYSLISLLFCIQPAKRDGHTGGKERTNNIAMGINHAPGVLHERSVERCDKHNSN